jgi:3D (Asp-Asp-Asp) domain-containing protein
MRSITNRSVVIWLLGQINGSFFLGLKGLLMIILAIGGVAVWLSVGGEDHGPELISLSRPWIGQSDDCVEVSLQNQTVQIPEFQSNNEVMYFTDEQLVNQLRALPAIALQSRYQTPKPHKVDKWVTVRMRVTGYCACSQCCGVEDGITANMYRIRPGDRLVAADEKFRFGTQVRVPGYNSGQPVKVMDRGQMIQGNRLDVFFHKHAMAKNWGVKYLNVRVKVNSSPSAKPEKL